MKTAEYQIPTAPAGWFLSEYPSVGALVVPLGNTEADLADALARGWRPLLVTKANTRTGRATARTSELEARPVVYSGRGGGGWRQGGRWVWFATPRTPIVPVAPDTTVWDAYRAEQAAEAADVRPVWLYGAAAGTEGEPTPEGAELADDAPDTTPRPTLASFAQAANAAVAARDSHAGSCPRCACAEVTPEGGWCARFVALVRRAHDAQQAANGAYAMAAR